MKLTEIAKIPKIWGRNVMPQPDMTPEQKSMTLLEVLRREKNRYVDRLVPAAAMSISIRKPEGEDEAEFCVVFNETMEGVGSYEVQAFLTDNCHDALAEKCGVPVKYYQRCGDHLGAKKSLNEWVDHPADHPLVWNVNFWLSSYGKQRFTIRMWKDDKGRLLCRAILSDRYRFIDNFTVGFHALTTAGKALQDQGLQPPECFGWNLTEKGLDLMLFSTEMVADLGDPDPDAQVNMGKWGSHKLSSPAAAAFRAWRDKGTGSSAQSTNYDKSNDGSGGLRMATPKGHDRSNGGAPTGLVFGAVRIRNSETGDGSCQVRGSLMVTMCSNQLMGGFDTFMIHLGKQMGEEIVLRPETIEKENELVIAKIRDTITAMFTREKFQKLVDSVKKTQQVQIVAAVTAVQKIAEKVDVLKGLEEEILKMYARRVDQEKDTLYDMVQAVTNVASNMREEYPHRAYDIENTVSGWITENRYPQSILVAAK